MSQIIHYQIKFIGKNFEERKTLDKFLSKTVNSYTGTAGKNFCFDFQDEHFRDDFLKEFVTMLNKNGCNTYQFFAKHGIVKT